MKSAYQIIRRPVITEKGLAIKENQNTLVFQVAPAATKTEIRQAVQSIFKVKVLFGAHRHLSRKRTPPGKVCRLPSRLEESVRAVEVRRKDAGVRAELIVVSRRSSVVSKADAAARSYADEPKTKS